MQLKASPYHVFEQDDSPLSLHGRRRWMNGTGRADSLAKNAVQHIASEQHKDGSWDGAAAPTIQHLFALLLLGGAPRRVTSKALDWLMEAGRPPLQLDHKDGSSYSHMFFRTSRRDYTELRHMRDVPFTPGCSGFVKTGAALFFAVQFGRQDHPRVRNAFSSIAKTAKVRNGRLCSGSCANNIHLALAAHPRYRSGPALRHVLSHLEKLQKSDGSWDKGVPFYPTLWILSHLNSRPANSALQRALGRVQRTQNRDGSWGRTQKQLNAFLLLDALERKAIPLETEPALTTR